MITSIKKDDDIVNRFSQVMADVLGINPDDITMSFAFSDWGLGFMEKVDVLEEATKTFELRELRDIEIFDINTVGDAVTLIRTLSPQYDVNG